jgi:SNF family Na+-dependent transporter
MIPKKKRGVWSSNLAFVFAAAGSAVGLGNLWRFSYVAGNNGGGLFVFIYLIAVLLIALPVLLAELSMGRFSNSDTVGAFEAIKPKTAFKGVGYLGFTAAIMILAFYTVIAGQTLGYIYKSFSGELKQLSKSEITVKPKEQLAGIFNQFRINAGYDFEKSKTELIDFFSEYKIDKALDRDKLLLLDKAITLLDKLKSNKQYVYEDNLKNISRQVELKLLVKKSGDIYKTFEDNKVLQIVLMIVFIFLTIFIVSKGVSGGIEKFTKIFMPVLLIILLIMIIRAITLPDAIKGIIFYLKPKFSSFNPKLVISAVGQAFFSLSLGMGTMITYGSYVNKKENLPYSTGMIGLFDTGIAIIAGFIVFPVIFSLGMGPNQGSGGIFNVLPILFSKIPLGQIFGILFFSLLAIAALTSTISLLEVPVAYMVDQKKWNRKKAAYLLGLLTVLFAVPCALSSGFFGLWDTIWGSFALTIGGLFISIFVGWIWKPQNALKEITADGKVFKLAKIWAFLIKYIIPVVIIIILVSIIVDTL